MYLNTLRGASRSAEGIPLGSSNLVIPLPPLGGSHTRWAVSGMPCLPCELDHTSLPQFFEPRFAYSEILLVDIAVVCADGPANPLDAAGSKRHPLE